MRCLIYLNSSPQYHSSIHTCSSTAGGILCTPERRGGLMAEWPWPELPLGSLL